MSSGFEHLQSTLSSGSSSKLMFNCSIRTKTDAKLKATRHLLLTASRLLSAANVLDEHVKVISSDESSCSLINKRSQHMKRYIVPMISYAANSVMKINKSFAPIPSVSYVHCIVEAKRKSEVVDKSSNSRISPDLQLVCDYVAHEDKKKQGDTHEITPPKKKLRVASCHDRRRSSDDVILPRKPEVALILSA